MSDYIEHASGGPEVRENVATGWSGSAEAGAESGLSPQKGKHLATLAVAALAPTLIKSTVKFIVRHPLLTAAGLAGYAVATVQSQHRARDAAA